MELLYWSVKDLSFDQETFISFLSISHTYSFNTGPPVLTQAKFPDDMDTTSLGITILKRPTHVANLVMDKMLQYQTPDGLMQVRECRILPSW